MTKTSNIKRFLSFFVVWVTVIALLTQSSFALTKEDRLRLYTPFYDECSTSTSYVNSGVPSDGTVWQSGIQPPYILEQFAIETLKAVAHKRNVPSSNTVTKEHVIALLAFAWGEGGDINNRWLYNPLNTGLNAPELIDGTGAGDGTQSFKSFDAGVEATARTMVGNNQERLATTLIDPNTTAEQFMHALTYFSEYAGNKFWAAASLPPNQDSYYRGRIRLVQHVINNYNDVAAVVIGTPAQERNGDNIRRTDLLSGINGGGQTGGGQVGSPGADECGQAAATGGAVMGNIVQTALNLAWPEKHDPPKEPKPEYSTALAKYNPGMRADGADCGIFVATVIRASGADPQYPASGTSVQMNYVKSHPEKYDIFDNPQSTADLQPGDIMIVEGNNGPGHTYIYVGPQPPSGYDQASASLNSRTANLGKSTISDSRGTYTRVRIK